MQCMGIDKKSITPVSVITSLMMKNGNNEGRTTQRQMFNPDNAAFNTFSGFENMSKAKNKHNEVIMICHARLTRDVDIISSFLFNIIGIT
jgi:hypothetical protein